MKLGYLAGCFLVALAVGCGPGDGSGDADGGTGGDGGGGTVDASNSCTTAEGCASGVCDPATNTCVDVLTCTDHDDCGKGATCDNGQCARSTTGAACNTEDNCTMNEGCVGGYCGCGGDQFIAEAVPPNVMILLDRSGSMNNEINNVTKWDIAETAINTLLTNYGATVRFGLSLWPPPGGGSCDTGGIDVDVGDNTAATITMEIGDASPGGSTPMGPTLQAMVGYAGLEDMTRENYVLLITDGVENCGGTSGPDAATNLVNKNPSIKTFVVGFGSGVDATALDSMAMNGGTALASGPPYYYQADDAASLDMALNDIGGAVLSCTYTLDQVPESADFYIYFDDVAVAEDMTDGWTYDPSTNTVTFNGPACDSLRTGAISDLVIVHNCPIGVD